MRHPLGVFGFIILNHSVVVGWLLSKYQCRNSTQASYQNKSCGKGPFYSYVAHWLKPFTDSPNDPDIQYQPRKDRDTA